MPYSTMFTYDSSLFRKIMACLFCQVPSCVKDRPFEFSKLIFHKYVNNPIITEAKEKTKHYFGIIGIFIFDFI